MYRMMIVDDEDQERGSAGKIKRKHGGYFID